MSFSYSIYCGPVIRITGVFEKAYAVYDQLMEDMNASIGTREDAFELLQRHLDYTIMILAPSPIENVDYFEVTTKRKKPATTPKIERRYFNLSDHPIVLLSQFSKESWINWVEMNYYNEIQYIKSRGFDVEIDCAFLITGS